MSSGDAMMSPDAPRTPAGTPVLLAGRIMMLYAGAGNKFVSRHLELHPGKLHVLLDGTSEPQQIISLDGCILADCPTAEQAKNGFAVCRGFASGTDDGQPASPSRLGQLVFQCFRVEHKQVWMSKLQEEIWRADSAQQQQLAASAQVGGAAESAVKQSRLNKLRFSAANYVIDRGNRPPLLQAFLLKRTGKLLQDYVVRWCELRDRISSETVTSLGGIIYATYATAPPGGWSVVPMRVDTTVTRSPEKNRVAVAGPNQDTVFFKFSGAEQLDEWASVLEMLVERARLENDPQFAMQLKLGDGSFGQRNEQHARVEQDDLAETMAMTKLRRLQVGGGGGDDGDDDASGGGAGGQFNLAFDSDDDDDNGDDIDAGVAAAAARGAAGGSSLSRRNRRQRRDDAGSADGDRFGGFSGGDSGADSGGDGGDTDSDGADSTEYEMRDLAADSPRRVHFAKVLYALDRTVHADRDSERVAARLQEIVASPPSRFRPDVSPYVPRGGGAEQAGGSRKRHVGFAAHDAPAPSPFSNYDEAAAARSGRDGRDVASPGPGEESGTVTVEDVLMRFERRLAIAVELLGPSAVVQRLLSELDADASDLRYAALYVLDTFPRQLRAAQVAARIDEALGSFQAIRESVLVRADMARFREEFRIGGPSTATSSSSAAAGVSVAIVGGGGGSSSPSVASPISAGPVGASIRPPPKTSDSAAALTVDEALRAINRVTIEKAGSGESTAKLRDAIQFLTHFLSQFREAFDVYDDAGYVVEEVGSAIDRATGFLREL